MAKRKRVDGRVFSSGAKTQDNSAEGIEVREKKRRKRSTSPNTDPADTCAELYEIIRNYLDDSGRILCESYIRAPKRRNSPEYFEVVSTPIKFVENSGEPGMSFKEEMEEDGIEEEEEEEEEEDDDEEEDGESGEDDRAEKGKPIAWKGGNGGKRQLTSNADDDDNESTSTQDDEEGDSSANILAYCGELVSAVLELKDSHGRVVCHLFKKLPPQGLYPEYYEIIKEPIDLKTICTKLRNNQYFSLEDAEKDLLLMVKNAHAFNEPGSQVYKDATAIKKTIQTKKAEIDHTMKGAKSSKRLKARRSAGKMSTSVTALLDETEDFKEQGSEMPEEEEQYPEDSLHGDEEGSGGDQDSDNPLMMLFSEIHHFTDPTGRALSEPFLRLPSRSILGKMN